MFLISRLSYFLPAVGVLLLPVFFGLRASAQDLAAGQIIKLRSIEFNPDRLLVQAGDTLTFINQDPFKHDVYIVRTANPNVVVYPATTLLPGDSIVIPFQEQGLFTVYCTIHGGMKGKISTTGSFELTEEEKRLVASVKVLPPIVKIGETLFWDRAQCYQCHRMGERGEGLRGPDLSDIGFRARFQAQKLGLGAATEYLVQSLMEPEAYLVEGYTNAMATVYQPPIDLDAKELTAVIAYLQSQGGEVDTWAINLNSEKLATLPAMNPFRRGDAERGKAAFQEVGCNSCHTVGAQKAVSVGPDLTQIGAYHNWTWLAESLVDPNAEIGKEWHYATVYLVPDEDDVFALEETVEGFLRKNTDAEVEILVAPERLERLPKERVTRIEVSELSKMPTNYVEILSFQQMADLITYLQTLKGSAP